MIMYFNLDIQANTVPVQGVGAEKYGFLTAYNN